MSSHASGFTLTQMLAVIAIIAVLAALLIPSISAARDHALAAKCAGNLRQIGAALMAFAADNNGAIPTPTDKYSGAPRRAWANRLYLGGYITSPDVFFCPSFFPRNNAEADATQRPTYNGSNTPQAYGMRTWVAPGKTMTDTEYYRGTLPLSVIATPANFFLIVDSLDLAAYGKPAQNYHVVPGNPDQIIHLRHQKMANALFADGHVEAKPGEYFQSLGNPDDQGGQRAYQGGKTHVFTVSDKLQPPF